MKWLLLQAGTRPRRVVHHPRGDQGEHLRGHRGVLQPRPPALLPGLLVSGGIRAVAQPEKPSTSAPVFLGKTTRCDCIHRTYELCNGMNTSTVSVTSVDQSDEAASVCAAASGRAGPPRCGAAGGWRCGASGSGCGPSAPGRATRRSARAPRAPSRRASVFFPRLASSPRNQAASSDRHWWWKRPWHNTSLDTNPESGSGRAWAAPLPLIHVPGEAATFFPGGIM